MADILLATPDDVVARLGRPLTDSEALRAPAILADLSADVIGYCRRDFQLHTQETQVLYATDSEITLQRPVIAKPGAGQVVLIGGAPGIPDFPVPWFTFDGIDRVVLAGGDMSSIINLPEAWNSFAPWAGTARVTYSWGYDSVPSDVKSVIANAAKSILITPDGLAAGLTGETIGPYSWRGERTGGGLAVALKAADLDRLKDYRNPVRTVQVRLR